MLTDDDLEKFFVWQDPEWSHRIDDNPNNISAEKWLTKQEIYELNKTRDTCISCGAKTEVRQLFSSSIKFCACVERPPGG